MKAGYIQLARTGTVISENHQLASALHKLLIGTFTKRKSYSSFYQDNILQLIKGLDSPCVIGIYNKYIWVFPLKGKNGITIINLLPHYCHRNIMHTRGNYNILIICSDSFDFSKYL